MSFSSNKSSLHGFSLPEILVTIAIVGILAAIGLNSFGDSNRAATLAQAKRLTEKLNGALKSFNQANWDIKTAMVESASTDEFLVLRTLQWKAPASSGRFDVGAPYMPPTWNPQASSSTSDYRLLWNGRNFQLIAPGETGTGLRLIFDGTDYTSAHTFASGYKPEGAKW